MPSVVQVAFLLEEVREIEYEEMVALSDNTITYLGRTTFRNRGIPFGIKESDRLSHMYVGRTGTGKSTLLETLMRQDIAQGKGMALLDPHGDLAEKIVDAITEERQSDLVYFNAPDPSEPYGYNPLKRVVKDKRPLAASGLLEVMKKMWDDAWGPRMEHILRNALLVLLDQEHATLPDILRLFHDDAFRKRVGAECTNRRRFGLRNIRSTRTGFAQMALCRFRTK